MKIISKIVKDHLDHNLKASLEEDRLNIICLDCNEEIHSEMFEPETCIVSILTQESVINAVHEMGISKEDQEKVIASIGECTIEELAENMGDHSCCNEYHEQALKLELDKIAEDIIDGYVSEFNEDLPDGNPLQAETLS
ncbi:MAG TPA: hypothetical protein DCG34_07735 [Clostridiales bacterium]|nr:hypothetical protein [Clostridiales bacterium]